MAKFKVLKESVEHHIDEEEKTLLPRAHRALKQEEDQLRMEFAWIREQATA